MVNLAAGALPLTGSQFQPDQTVAASQDYKTVASSEPEYGSGGGQEYGGGQMGYGGGNGYGKEEKYPHQPYGFGYNIDGK